MSFILRWKPSVMPLFLVKRHMAAKGSRQRERVSAKVKSEEKQLGLSSSMKTSSFLARGRQARFVWCLIWLPAVENG